MDVGEARELAEQWREAQGAELTNWLEARTMLARALVGLVPHDAEGITVAHIGDSPAVVAIAGSTLFMLQAAAPTRDDIRADCRVATIDPLRTTVAVVQSWDNDDLGTFIERRWTVSLPNGDVLSFWTTTPRSEDERAVHFAAALARAVG